MCINRTVRPRIGGNMSGKYKATVRPIKPIAVMCIHMSYRKNISEKNIDIIDGKDVPLGDRLNIVFKSTQVNNGRAAGIVVATGMQTEIGRIAGLLQEITHQAGSSPAPR